MVAGLVQTGSVFLQAKPEKYRCRNFLDIKYENFNYSKYQFASAESCNNWDFDWSENCAEGEEEECFSRFTGNLTCNTCSEYIYSDENTFQQTAVSQSSFLKFLNCQNARTNGPLFLCYRLKTCQSSTGYVILLLFLHRQSLRPFSCVGYFLVQWVLVIYLMPLADEKSGSTKSFFWSS